MSLNRILTAIGASALIVLVSMGIRQSFGILLGPVATELGTGREVFSLAIAVQNLVFGLPIAGLISDQIGARRVAVLGGLIYAAGLYLMGAAEAAGMLFTSLGLLIGVALSCTSYVVILGAVAQVVPANRRTFAFGLITTAGSFGMFLVVPLVQGLVIRQGWREAVTTLSLVAIGIALLALLLPGRRVDDARQDREGSSETTLARALTTARTNRNYWLLNAGFFVCGFHVAFIATHLPAYLADNGLPTMEAAAALSMIGLFNIFGSTLFGYLGDRYRKKYLLSGLYFARAIVIALFLLAPVTRASSLLFGASIGFLWLATVPLTSGMVAQIFGSRYLASLYGIVFFSHQVGAFLGVWLGGRIYDASGSYLVVWLLAVGLGIIAALLHLPMSDRRVGAPAMVTEPA